MKSAIITDLPPNSTKTPKKKTSAKRGLSIESSSESETELSLVKRDSDVSITEMLEDEQEISSSDTAIKQGIYVLVGYEKKRKVHFVGQVLKEEDEDGDLEVKFRQKHPMIRNGFVEPSVEDIHSVPASLVILVLPQPLSMSGSTKRAMCIKKFSTDLFAFEM